MEKYLYRITTMKKSVRQELYKNEEDFNKKVAAFNIQSTKVSRSYKEIEGVEFLDGEIQFILNSKTDLGDHPNLKPLFFLTKSIAQDATGIYDEYIQDGRIFKLLESKRIEEKVDNHLIISTVIDILLSENPTKDQLVYRDKINEIIGEYHTKIGQ